MPRDYRLYLEDILEAIIRIERYFGISLTIIWDVVTNHLGSLQHAVATLLADEPDSPL